MIKIKVIFPVVKVVLSWEKTKLSDRYIYVWIQNCYIKQILWQIKYLILIHWCEKAHDNLVNPMYSSIVLDGKRLDVEQQQKQTLQWFQDEQVSHQTTRRHLQDQKLSHETTRQQLQQEKASAEKAQQQLAVEIALRGTTQQQFQDERSAHKRTQEELEGIA